MVRRHADVQFVNLDALTYAGNLANLVELASSDNYMFVRGDVADGRLVEALFEEHGFSTVVHFAAESHVDRSIENPLEFVRTNVIGTTVLLDASRRRWGSDAIGSDYRFHHVSTDEVFGSLGDTGVFSEETAYSPRSPYAASKASSDHFVRAYAETYKLPIVITNCSNNYGPYQFPEKLIPLVISNAAAGGDIPVYGAGANVRDWLFVADHCEALDTVLHHGQNGATYLIGGKNEMPNLRLVETILDLVDEALGREQGTGRKLIRFVTDRPGHDFRYAVDTSRIERELGWKPSHSLKDGLKLTVDWYLAHAEWLRAVQDESYKLYYDKMYGDRLKGNA